MNGLASPGFANRSSAGALLGKLLAARGVLGPGSVVLGLLRGGVPVAAGISATAGCRLGALAVRKLGVPSDPEVAFGAVAAYGFQRSTHLVPRIHQEALLHWGPDQLNQVRARAGADLEALATRFAAHAPALAGRAVILCDDGLATGATMHAALEVVSGFHPAEIFVAVPVAPAAVVQEFSSRVTAVFCLHSNTDFGAVGAYYQDFSQVNEDAVLRLLETHRTPGS